MVGQNKIKQQLKAYQLCDLPKNILLLGEAGCGKHTLAKDLASHFSIEFEEITETISAELITDISTRVFPKIYFINIDALTDREQNTILKFIEEPSPSAYIIMASTSVNRILPTVLNRCMTFEFEPYTIEELRTFLVFGGKEDEANTILSICKTPGKLINLDTSCVSGLLELCTKIATRLNTANFANTLTIANKINYKDEYNKYEFSLFLDTLTYILYKQSIENDNELATKLYLVLVEYMKRLKDSRLNKEVFMYNLLVALWKEARR